MRGVPIVILAALLLAGCRSPSKANILLRKENQSLKDELSALRRRADADRATIAALQADRTLSVPAPDVSDRLFTVNGIRIGRLTGSEAPTSDLASPVGFRVQFSPTDEDGQKLKAAGRIRVEILDSQAAEGSPAIANWDFDTAASRKLWHGDALLYDYLLTCPVPANLAGGEVTIRVTFTDELTARQFSDVKKIRLPRGT